MALPCPQAAISANEGLKDSATPLLPHVAIALPRSQKSLTVAKRRHWERSELLFSTPKSYRDDPDSYR